MIINASTKRRYKLVDLMAEMPAGKLPMAVGWDKMIPVGREVF
jgi:hypothetical protein